MAYTPLEKIILPIFEGIDKSFGDRNFHSFKYQTSEGMALKISLPWFAASDEELLGFLNDPSFFYRCIHNGLTTEYVIVPFFYTLAKHDPSCTDTKICQHTKDLMFDFLIEPANEQEEIIDGLLKKNLYEDRLQFLWSNNSADCHIFDIRSEATTSIDGDGDYVIIAGLNYQIKKHNGLQRVSESAQKAFSKLEKLFEENISRHELDEYWLLSSMIKEVLEEKYTEKKQG